MLSHPRANFTVSVVSLLRCSNFYVEDFPQQPTSQSFKEPQSPSPVAIEAARHIAIRMAASIAELFDVEIYAPRLAWARTRRSEIHPLHKGRGLLSQIDKISKLL